MSGTVILVAGLGRCGSSLLMRMLDAAGVPVVGSAPDYETDLMSSLPSSADAWMQAAHGRAIKALDPHRMTPPRGPDYHCIWLTRDRQEQARSMLKLIGADQSRQNRRAMARSIAKDSPVAKRALMRAGAYRHGILEVRFEELVSAPADVAREIARYLRRDLDVAAMAACVIPRPVYCLPYLLEERLVA